MTINQSYQVVSLSEVKPHPQNPRVNDLDLIQKSIEVNGFYGAIVVSQKTGHILAGNHRYKAAQAQNIKSLPVIYVDVDEVAELKILAADNRTSDLGRYDDEALTGLLKQLPDLEGSGYNDFDFQELIASLDVELPPDDFAEIENLETNNQCPKCGYEY